MSPSNNALVISDETMHIYKWFVFGVLCQLINVFGIVTNVINIICFVKQGFDDSVNISLLGLSISDLGSLITMAGICVCLTPAALAADLTFDLAEVGYLTAAMLHLSFNRVSSCITAMITLERCLCITAPLQIKSLITPKRATTITASVFVIFFFSGFPVYAVSRLDRKFFPQKNKTLVGLVSIGDREKVETITFAINNFSIPFGAFVIIVVCTAILSFKLQGPTKWRQKTITTTGVDCVSSRNQRASKMVVMISALFITCFVSLTIIMMSVAFVPELSVFGKYLNLSMMIAGLTYFMETINSSMNVFIYYQMSSKYRGIFTALFRGKKD